MSLLCFVPAFSRRVFPPLQINKSMKYIYALYVLFTGHVRYEILGVLGSIASLYCGFRSKVKKWCSHNEDSVWERVVLVAYRDLLISHFQPTWWPYIEKIVSPRRYCPLYCIRCKMKIKSCRVFWQNISPDRSLVSGKHSPHTIDRIFGDPELLFVFIRTPPWSGMVTIWWNDNDKKGIIWVIRQAHRVHWLERREERLHFRLVYHRKLIN